MTPLPLLGAALGFVLLVFLVAITLVWWRQERIAYQPPRGAWPPALGVERLAYSASDGQPLFAYLVGRRGAIPAPGDRLVLVFHGNADLAVWQIDWARELAARTGMLVLLAEYRGYAGLPGTPAYAGLQRDALAAHAVATDSLGVAPGDVVIFGHSLGSAVATELAAELEGARAPAALVLQSPFTSARSMARFLVWRPLLALWHSLSRIHYDTRARVRALDVPVWVAHGSRDYLVPVRMGHEVYAAARRRGEFLLVRGAGHNDVADVGGEEYWAWIGRAVQR